MTQISQFTSPYCSRANFQVDVQQETKIKICFDFQLALVYLKFFINFFFLQNLLRVYEEEILIPQMERHMQDKDKDRGLSEWPGT